MAKRKNKILEEPTTPVQSKLFINLLKSTRQYIQGRSYSPLPFQGLMQKLGLPEQHTDIFTDVLKVLINEKQIKLKRSLYEFQEKEEDAVTGIIHMHPRGFGFVTLDIPTGEGDIFIPKHLTLNAVDGDHVEVAINTEVVSEKGPEGKVLTILSRSRTHVAGIITSITSFGQILAHVPLLGSAQQINVKPTQEFDLKEGDRVVMQVLDWGSKEHDMECTVSHYLGHISDPACDIAAAIEEYELANEFPDKVIKEAKSFGKHVTAADITAREDLRDLECFTIDPTTAKDFDDALTLTKDSKGHYQLIVHIADVAHYVTEGSAIDKEASKRCNSTYFPGTCLPMLPKELSENLCSLKADVNRLTISVAMDFDEEGNLMTYRIFRSVINSNKRFTYSDAKEVLDGKKRSKHAPTLKLMVELCNKLKAKRYERGSLEFALPDLVIIVDANGVPTGTDYVVYDITHQLVEEFMLKANETVAKHLNKEGKSLAYRIHEEPSEENMKDFSILANAFGFNLPERPQPFQLQELFNEAMQTSFAQYLAVSYIRRMRQAQYSPENIGHYGLGLTHYCHFTSPIRRYVDLVIHRSLFEDSLDIKKLDLLTKQCSDQERISAKAENSVSLLKKLRFLDKIQQETPYKQYEAVVTRIKAFGLSFEILELLLEGFLHVSELEQDYFVFDNKRMQLCGRHTQKVYASGDRITLTLKEVNFTLLESKWNLVREERTGQKRKPKSRENYSKFKGSVKGKSRSRRDVPEPVAVAAEPESFVKKKKVVKPVAKKSTVKPVEKKLVAKFNAKPVEKSAEDKPVTKKPVVKKPIEKSKVKSSVKAVVKAKQDTMIDKSGKKTKVVKEKKADKKPAIEIEKKIVKVKEKKKKIEDVKPVAQKPTKGLIKPKRNVEKKLDVPVKAVKPRAPKKTLPQK